MYNLNKRSSLDSSFADDFSKSKTPFEIKYKKWEADFSKKFGSGMRLEDLEKFIVNYINDSNFKNYIISKLSIIMSELESESDRKNFFNFLKTNGVTFND